MLKGISVFLLLCVTSSLWAQTQNEVNKDYDYKYLLINEIQEVLDAKIQFLDSSIQSIDARSLVIDKAICSANDMFMESEKLKERLMNLEQKQNAVEDSEIAIYQANYQSAIINLVSMEREIKPLTLYNATRDFTSAITAIANPMEYPGYKAWFDKFYDYIEKQKTKEPILGVLSHMISLSGGVGSFVPFSGPYTETLFSGINSYIQSLGSNKKDIREESQKMFLITASLAQWNHENELIEREWSVITTELQLLQKQYEKTLNSNMTMMEISPTLFDKRFCNENDAHKRYLYLTELTENCGHYISQEKVLHPREWKEKVYFQMMDVQSLKLRFGNITSRINENINKYGILVSKYKNDPYIGFRIATLEPKLREMMDVFERSFEPSEYLSSSTRMYRVH